MSPTPITNTFRLSDRHAQNAERNGSCYSPISQLATSPWCPHSKAAVLHLLFREALKSKANKYIFDGTLQESNPEQASNPSFCPEELHVYRVSQATQRTLIKRVGFKYKKWKKLLLFICLLFLIHVLELMSTEFCPDLKKKRVYHLLVTVSHSSGKFSRNLYLTKEYKYRIQYLL